MDQTLERPNFRGELQEWSSRYSDTEEWNIHVVNSFRKKCQEIPYLWKHRSYVEQNNAAGLLMGHGDRCVQFVFKLLVDEMPPQFRFLEIGVFKGQICSLIQLLADQSGRPCEILGVTPLYDPELHMGTGFARYNRLPFIEKMYRDQGVSFAHTKLIDGRSQDEAVLKRVLEEPPFNIVYIDGDHSYEATALDIVNFSEKVAPGGFLVIDDASNFKHFPNVPDPVHQAPRLWTGYEEVSRAVRDTVEKDSRFVDILTSMHVRVFWRKS